MGHLTSKSYHALHRRLDSAVQGGPDSETFRKILSLLFTESEANLVSVLPLNFFTVEDASKKWKKNIKESRKILDRLADKGILFDLERGNAQAYFLAPTMAGFFEFSLMRTDNEKDHPALSELLWNYLHKDREYWNSVFTSDPCLARIYPNEFSISPESVVLDYEKASEVIRNARLITLGRCYCRHKMEHLGKKCKFPQETCMTLNDTAQTLIKHNLAKEITKKAALEKLKECRDLGLVQIGDNIQKGVNWICNCCSCCCEGIAAYKKLGAKTHVQSNFTCEINKSACLGCGICVKKCPVGALKLIEKGGRKTVEIDKGKCFGCGVCVTFCSQKARSLKKITNPRPVPEDTFERILLIALDKGKLQNYLIENSDIITHEILRRFIGFVLSLKPAQRLVAQKQLRSRFIKLLLKTKKFKLFEKFLDKKENEN